MAAIVLPVAFLAAIDLVRHVLLPGALHTLAGFIATDLVTAAGVIAFAVVMFGLIGRLQRRIVDQNTLLSEQNRELTELHQQVQDSATLVERERIARELHDGMGQVLGCINVQTLAVRAMLDRGDEAGARAELARMQANARTMYEDVREGILGLRATGRKPGGFFGAVGDYVTSYREMFGIRARVDADGAATATVLSPTAEIQLIRIIQEALTNVRKHSGAGSATVAFGRENGHLRVAVSDDGRGFDRAAMAPGWPRYGLDTMRERAGSIGGTLEIESAAGRGTTVKVTVPVHEGRDR